MSPSTAVQSVVIRESAGNHRTQRGAPRPARAAPHARATLEGYVPTGLVQYGQYTVYGLHWWLRRSASKVREAYACS